MSEPPACPPGSRELSPAQAIDRVLPALHTGLRTVLAQGTSYAELPTGVLAQFVRRLLQALRHGLHTSDCGVVAP